MDWENSEMIGQNKEPPHNTLIPYHDITSALSGKYESSLYYKSLNGNWKFNWVKKPSKRPIHFYKINFNFDQWNEIPVINNKVVISKECKGCGRCISVCPHDAIEIRIEDEHYVKKSIEEIDNIIDIA